MEFNIIETQEDIDYLMEKFFFFHDSCIKELKYCSGGYVAENRAMYPFNSMRDVRVIFQSQKGEFPAIEMKFELIQKLNLAPRTEDYDCIIYEASIVKIDDLFYWSEWSNFELNDINKSYGTWISAKTIKWRRIDDAMGDREMYISDL